MTNPESIVRVPAKEVQGGEVSIAPVSWRHRWRDVGLFVIGLGFFVVIILGWRETSTREKMDASQTEERIKAIDQFKKDLATFQWQLADTQKTTQETNKFKQELSNEFKTTRKMVFEAWKTNKEDTAKLFKEVESLRKAVIRLEKTAKKE